MGIYSCCRCGQTRLHPTRLLGPPVTHICRARKLVCLPEACRSGTAILVSTSRKASVYSEASAVSISLMEASTVLPARVSPRIPSVSLHSHPFRQSQRSKVNAVETSTQMLLKGERVSRLVIALEPNGEDSRAEIIRTRPYRAVL
jgi:hypothetical protein